MAIFTDKLSLRERDEIEWMKRIMAKNRFKFKQIENVENRENLLGFFRFAHLK